MRDINNITLHCSDSDNAFHDNIETIKTWHTLPPPRGKGWDDVGYNYFIRKNGTIEIGRILDHIPASAKGFNKNTVAICLSGAKSFSDLQFKSCAKLCMNLMLVFSIPIESIFPHNHFNPNKTCPNFNISMVKKFIILP